MAVIHGRLLNHKAWLVNAAVSGGGSTATLSSSTAFDTRRVFNRDVYVGNPSGYATTYNKGWASVPFKLTPSQAVATGLWMRLHDALDPAALSGSPGSGAVLQAPIQVAASLAAGSNTVNVTIPAAKAWYYADFALDAAMTTPLRVVTPFGVGHVTGIGPTTSHGFRFVASGTGLSTDVITTMVAVSPYSVIYAPYAAGLGVTGTGSWDRPGDLPGASYATAAGAEYLRLMVNQLGVVCAIAGDAQNGGSTVDFQPAGGKIGWITNALAHGGGGKWDAQVSICAANDRGLSSRAVIAKRLTKAFDTIQAANGAPNVPTVTCATPVWFADYGSSDWRYTFLATRDVERARANTIAFDQFDSGGYGINGHSTQPGRKRWAVAFFRYIAGLMGPAKGGVTLNRGPKVVSATRTGAVIRVTVQHDQGTALVKYGWTEPYPGGSGTDYSVVDPTTIADTQLAPLVSIYPAGKAYADSTRITATKITIVNATQFDVYLASDPDTTGTLGFDFYYALDLISADAFAASGANGSMRAIKDDTDQGGVGYGMDVRQTFDPVYITPASPPAQSIAVSAPVATVAGAWIALKGGAGSGLPLAGAGSWDANTSIEVSVGGGPWTVPDFLIVKNDNSWSGFVAAPSTPATGVSIAVRRAGQTTADATTTVNIVTARNALPASSQAAAVGQWDASNRGAIWQDAGRTVPAAHFQPVRVLDDALGTAANAFVATSATNPDVAPYLDIRKPCYYSTAVSGKYPCRNDPSLDRPCLVFEASSDPSGGGRFMVGQGTPPLLSTVQGSCSFLLIHDFNTAYSSGYVQFAKTGAAPNYGWTHNALNSPNLRLIASGSSGQPVAQRFANDADPNGVYIAGASPTSPPGAGRVNYTIVTYNAATGALACTHQNGATASFTVPDLSAVTFNTMLLGAASTYSGAPVATFTRFHELVVFNAVLTSAQQTDLFAYAAAKWPG